MENEVYILKFNILHIYRNYDGEAHTELAISFLCPVDRHHKDSKAVIRSICYVCLKTIIYSFIY